MKKFANCGTQALCQKNRLNVVRESCSVWMNRLYRMTQNDRNHLRE